MNPFYLLLDQALSSPAAGQEETLIKTALAGAPSVDYVRTPIDGNVIVAAHPIVNQLGHWDGCFKTNDGPNFWLRGLTNHRELFAGFLCPICSGDLTFSAG